MTAAPKKRGAPANSHLARRRRIVLGAVAVLGLGAAVGATLAARSDDQGGPAAEVSEVSRSGAIAPPSPFKGALRPPAPAKGFSLRDQDGDRVSLAGERGKVVVLSPMYTTCRTTCPLIAQQIADAISDLSAHERKAVRALALSVDPANDTRARARQFLRQRHVQRHLDFLLGSRTALRPLWRAYGFAPQGRRREHNSYAVLIDRRGRARVGFQVSFLTPEALAHDIRLLLRS